MKYNSHSLPSTYPYHYSEQVIAEFENKYARVMLFISKKLGFTPKYFRLMLINAFMNHNGHWNVVRETLKYVDRHDLYGLIATMTKEEAVKYLTSVRTIVEDWLIDDEKLR